MPQITDEGGAFEHTFCGNSTGETSMYNSTGRILHVTFKSDETISESGFAAEYWQTMSGRLFASIRRHCDKNYLKKRKLAD